jgi:hypothetical protein
MESSNGFYYDPVTRTEVPFTAKKWKEMGLYLCKGFGLLKFDQNSRMRRSMTQKISKDESALCVANSDDEISEGNSDS